MALKINYSQGSIPAYVATLLNIDTIDLCGFYIRIDLQSTDHQANRLNVSWSPVTISDGGVEVVGEIISIFSKNYTAPIVVDSSENFITQGYKYLKTLPEFEGAIDC